jgi:hypothetical protein
MPSVLKVGLARPPAEVEEAIDPNRLGGNEGERAFGSKVSPSCTVCGSPSTPLFGSSTRGVGGVGVRGGRGIGRLEAMV